MSDSLFYMWDGKDTITSTHDIKEWGENRRDHHRVATDEVNGQIVSTVFLGIDHRSLEPGSVPILFETMIFNGPFDQEMCRYSFPSDAREGHNRVVERLRDLVSIKEITDGNQSGD